MKISNVCIESMLEGIFERNVSDKVNRFINERSHGHIKILRLADQIHENFGHFPKEIQCGIFAKVMDVRRAVDRANN